MWLCIEPCDRSSYRVTVHRIMWPCIVTRDRASYHVTVHRNTWPCIVTNFFTIKPTDAIISKFILVRNSTCFRQFLCPSSGVTHCTFGTGICYTGLTTASVQDQDGTESVEVLWTRNRHVADTSIWQHTTLTTDKHRFPGRDSNPQSQQASGRRPTP
jgi:hypothetical protein